MEKLKVVLGTVVIIGILLQGIELYYAPDVLVFVSSKQYPEYLSWIRWAVTLIAAIGYLLIDHKETSEK